MGACSSKGDSLVDNAAEPYKSTSQRLLPDVTEARINIASSNKPSSGTQGESDSSEEPSKTKKTYVGPTPLHTPVQGNIEDDSSIIYDLEHNNILNETNSNASLSPGSIPWRRVS